LTTKGEIFPEFEANDVRVLIHGPNIPIDGVLRCKQLKEERFQDAGRLFAVSNPRDLTITFALPSFGRPGEESSQGNSDRYRSTWPAKTGLI
jgi:hypothetical protein